MLTVTQTREMGRACVQWVYRLYQNLVRNHAVDKNMAQVRPWTSCFTTMRADVVVFSFASDAVSDEDKTALAVALLVEEPTADDVVSWAEAPG